MKKYKTRLMNISIVSEPTNFPSFKVNQSLDIAEFMKTYWSNDIGIRESFYAVFLNRINRTVGIQLVSIGGTAGTVADPKLIFTSALGCLADSIIIVHNHPSGNLNPSQNDINLTKMIKEAAKVLNMKLLDHVIIGPEKNKHYSFADEGML